MLQPPLDPLAKGRELVATPNLTDDQLRDLLESTQAVVTSARSAEDTLHEQQALTLLALAHHKRGDNQAAQSAAEECLALSEKNADLQTTFDRACALAAAAKALNAGGHSQQALNLILEAVGEADKLNEEERTYFDRLFGEG